MEPGELPDSGTPVLRIDGTAPLEVSAFLPEEYYGRVEPGRTEMQVRTGEAVVGRVRILYRSPTVSLDLRTFEIKGLIEEPPAGLVPGRLVHLTVVLDRQAGIGVPREAIEERGDGPVVFRLEGSIARAVPVRPGLEQEGWVELRGETLPAGTPVVTRGQEFLESGREVRVAGEGG